MSATPKTKPAPSPEAGSELAVPMPKMERMGPDPDDVKDAMTAAQYAQDFKIETARDSAIAQVARGKINTKIKILGDKRLRITRKIDEAKRAIMELFSDPIEKLKAAKVLFDIKIIAYDDAQQEICETEQRRLDKIAADEQQRLQEIANKARIKADADAKKLRDDAAAAEAAGDAARAAEIQAKAERIEDRAEEKAQVFEERASAVVAPIALADTEQVAGSSFREVPEFEVIDEDKINRAFMTPDSVKIGKVVKSLGKDAVGIVGRGLKVTMKKILATRRV